MINAKPQNTHRGQRDPPCECVFSLTNYILNKQEKFQIFSFVNSISTRNKYHFHGPVTTGTCFQISMYCADINVFSGFVSQTSS
jgi:hypothetical protein